MLSISNLSFSYGSVQALKGVNLEVAAGQVTCVIGRNGVGKTTLMKNIAGVLQPGGGTIGYGGADITRFPAHKRARAGIGLVPQGRQIFPKLTIEENLAVALEARHSSPKRVPDEVFALFPVLKTMSKRLGGDLSGGQQQQLAIARALVGEPKVLLLDEPTEGIQPNVIQQIGVVLRQLTERGMTIVLVEQYLDFVREFGHHFYIMNRGRVVSQGKTADLTAAVVDEHLAV